MWHRKHPEMLFELRERLNDAFPELKVIDRNDIVIIAGTYSIVDGRKVIDRYQIELQLPRSYPRGIPILRETGGRIPCQAARHVEADGSCCLFVPDEFFYEHPDGMDAIDFIEGPVRGFLVGQSLVERGEKFPFGERSHGPEGILEFYRNLLGVEDPKIVSRYIEVLAAKKYRTHWTCPCGSGERMRDCCGSRVEELRDRIPHVVARRSLERLKLGCVAK